MRALNLAYKQLKNNTLRQLSLHSGRLLSKPLHVSIEPSKRCNARCIMCPSWKITEDYLDSEEIIKTLKVLKDWMGSDFYVSMAGGEAFIFKGIFDIIKYCTANGLHPMITTNAIKFNTETLDKIIDSGLSYIAISLDSHIPSVHDMIRGHEGLFHRAVEGIHYLKSKANMPVGVSTTLMSHNVASFPESIEYYLSLPIDRVLFQPIQIWDGQRDYAAWAQSDLWIKDRELIKKTMKALHEIKKRDVRFFNTEQDINDLEVYFSDPTRLAAAQNKKCTLGFEKVVIDYRGNIYLGCNDFPPIGNIKSDNIIECWKSEKAAELRKKMLNCPIPCTNNGYKQVSLSQKVRKFWVLLNAGFFSRAKNTNTVSSPVN